MIRNALKLFLTGILLGPVLINLIGLVSPFWAIFVLEDGSRSDELLTLFQPFVPLVSILFSISLVLLGQVDGRVWMKVICTVVSVVYMGSSIYGIFQQGTVFYPLLLAISSGMGILMLFLGGLILFRVFGKLPNFEDRPDAI